MFGVGDYIVVVRFKWGLVILIYDVLLLLYELGSMLEFLWWVDYYCVLFVWWVEFCWMSIVNGFWCDEYIVVLCNWCDEFCCYEVVVGVEKLWNQCVCMDVKWVEL